MLLAQLDMPTARYVCSANEGFYAYVEARKHTSYLKPYFFVVDRGFFLSIGVLRDVLNGEHAVKSVFDG